jgi:gas vesicle protein
MISKKILSTILAVAVAGGLGTVGAITLANTPKTAAVITSSDVSSIAESSSSAVNSVASQIVSSKEANTVSDSLSAIQKATDEGVNRINSATSQAVSQVQQAVSGSSSQTGLKKQTPPKYQIINPITGETVQPSDPNYETYKTKLGGDAGTVPIDKSEACHQAKAKILKASSAASK